MTPDQCRHALYEAMAQNGSIQAQRDLFQRLAPKIQSVPPGTNIWEVPLLHERTPPVFDGPTLPSTAPSFRRALVGMSRFYVLGCAVVGGYCPEVRTFFVRSGDVKAAAACAALCALGLLEHEVVHHEPH